MRLLQRLGILPEKPKYHRPAMQLPPITDDMIKIPNKFPQMVHQDLKEVEIKPFNDVMKKETKKRTTGWWDLMVMIRDFDRVQLKKWIKRVEIPENNPRNRFRGDIDRVVILSKEEAQKEREKRYIANIDDVLSRNKSTWNASWGSSDLLLSS